jgi:hypothetical protein
LGVAVASVRARAVGGDEDNSGYSDGRGPYNNQLKGPAEEKTAAATVTATDTTKATVTATDTATATATVKAAEKDENKANDNDCASRTATRTTSPGCTSRLETSPLPWHSVLVAMTVRKNRNNKKYTAQLPPVPPIVRLFCYHRRRLL